jgi:catechol 2,3-dioxygenase-like lactoylglutathione lyase family enzyme
VRAANISAGSAATGRVTFMLAFRATQVILFSDDLPRAVAFYARLGFAETFRHPADGEPIHVDLVLGGYKIGIATADSARDDHGLTPSAEGQRAAVILWTDDTASAYEELVASGAPALAGPHVFLGRMLIAWTADPDGHPIQISQAL